MWRCCLSFWREKQALDWKTTWTLKTPQSCWRNPQSHYLLAQAINECSGQAPAAQPIHGAPHSLACGFVAFSFHFDDLQTFTFLSISFCLDPHTWIVWKQGQCQRVNVGWIYLLYPFTALLIWSCPWCMSSQRGQFSCSYWYFHHTLSLSLSLTEPSFEDISIFALLQPEMSQENDSNWKGWKSLIWQMLTWASHECTTSGSPQEMQSNPQLSQLWGQAMISSMEEKTCGCHGCWWIITSSWFQLDFWFSTSQAGRLSIT